MTNRNTVQEIKEKLSIIDVVQPYVKLVRAGKYWRGLSPFNKEKTPSFFVSPERGTYHCFSSGQGGDIFTFVESMEGVDFKGALKILAEKSGVPLVFSANARVDNSHIDKLREIMSRAEIFYATQLPKESDAYVYVQKRGITEATIREWNLGYAPEGWRVLLEALSAQGFSTKEMVEAGLIKEADGKPGTFYDRFRNRLMFPIRDISGRTVAFTGRTLSADEQAKYLNSPETELFKKSNIIFGLSRAKDSIRTRGFVLLVEGQMDVLHCHQAGFTNTVALSGTALSEQHVSLLKRYADNLMLILDSDRAGLSATSRSAVIALSAGMKVKAVPLPDGEDPADLISRDKKEFSTRVADAKSVIEFFLATITAKESDLHKIVQEVETTVLPIVASVKSPMEKEYFIGVVAQVIATTPEAVRASLRELPTKQEVGGNARIIKPDVGEKRSASVIRAEALSAIVASYPDNPLAKRVQNEYARIVGDSSLPEPNEKVVFETGIAFGEEPEETAVDELIQIFERALLDEKYAIALDELRRAQASGEVEAEKQAETTCAELSQRIARCS